MLKDRGQIKKNCWKKRFMILNMAGLPRSTENRCEFSNVCSFDCMYGGKRNSFSCLGTGTLRVAVTTKPFVI